MNRVLVTGGAGYIGSELVQRLVSLPEVEVVRVLDNSHIHRLAFLNQSEKCELAGGDIRSDMDLEKCLTDVDTVFHLAAVVGDAPCDKAPEKAVEINVGCVHKIINFALKNDVKRIVFSSTCSLYGLKTGDDYMDEDSTVNPTSLYGKTKLDAERLLLKAHEESGLDVSICRLSTVYGASLPDSMQFNIFANLFVLNACKTKMIKVFGGDKWRPLLHVRDAANAFLAVGESHLTKISGQIFNVGNNRENYTIQRVAEIVAEEISGTKVAVEPTPGSNSSYKVQFDKIQDTLGFKPLYDLRKGVCELRDRILNGTYDGILLNQ